MRSGGSEVRVFDTSEHCTHPYRLGARCGSNGLVYQKPILWDPRIALHPVLGHARDLESSVQRQHQYDHNHGPTITTTRTTPLPQHYYHT
jgi:hypothetical protein